MKLVSLHIFFIICVFYSFLYNIVFHVSDTSPKVATTQSAGRGPIEGTRYRSPNGTFIEKLYYAFKGENKARKVVINVEICLPSRFFLRNFEESTMFVHPKIDTYPENMEEDFRFNFLTQG